jgi:hypothetical protein
MQIIENEVVSGKTIAIDEKHFVNCKYINCTVIYSGGDWSWTNTTFENCRFNLAGPAQKTATLLGHLGVLPQGGTIPPTGSFGFPKKPEGQVN